MQTFSDAVFKELKTRGVRFRRARKDDVRALDKALIDLNTTKMRLAEFETAAGREGHLRLAFLCQRYLGADLGLCNLYKIWKNRNDWQERCLLRKEPHQTECNGAKENCNMAVNVGVAAPCPEKLVESIPRVIRGASLIPGAVFLINEWSSEERLDANILVAGHMPEDYSLLSRVRFIQSMTASHRRFDVEMLKKNRIILSLAGESHATANAEMALSFLFSHLKNLNQYEEGDYDRKAVKLLSEVRILVVGFGHSGRKIYSMIKKLGGDAAVFDPYVSEQNVVQLGKQELQSQKFDVVIVVAQPKNRNETVLTEDIVNTLSEGGGVINVSREGYVSEDAVLRALREKGISYYSDFFQEEKFYGIKGTFYTPHVASSSTLQKRTVEEYVLNNISLFLNFGRPREVYVDITPSIYE